MGEPGPWSRPAFEPGHQLRRTHGAWGADVAVEALELVHALFDPGAVERHPMVALLGAETWIRLRRAEADVAERGLMIDGKPHPLLVHVNRWQGRMIEIAREYGMTPRSEAELVRDRADAARQHHDLERFRERGREVLDARSTEAS